MHKYRNLKRLSCFVLAMLSTSIVVGSDAPPVTKPAAVKQQGATPPNNGAGFQNDSGPNAAANKEVVTKFFNMVFRDHKVQQAFDLYVSPDFVEHHPWPGTTSVGNGRQTAIDVLTKEFARDPNHKLAVVRAIAQGDLVSVHAVSDGGDIDIFRVKDGKIVEHWDG